MPKNRVLAIAGEPCHELLAARKGVLELSRKLPNGRRQILDFRFPGELATPPDGDGRWLMSVRTVTAGEVCRVELQAFRNVARNYPELDRALLDLARDDVAHSFEHLVTLGRRRPEERVASFLLEMGERSVSHRNSEEIIELPMRRPEVADYLGLRTETVCRIFRRLKSSGIVALPRTNLVSVLNRPALETLAGDGFA